MQIKVWDDRVAAKILPVLSVHFRSILPPTHYRQTDGLALYRCERRKMVRGRLLLIIILTLTTNRRISREMPGCD
jgi:hypothetical protein